MADARLAVFACRRVADGIADAVALPCAGRVSAGMLLEALAAGAPGVAVVACGDDRHGCRHCSGAQRAALAVHRARRIAGRLGLEAERLVALEAPDALDGFRRAIERLGPTGVAGAWNAGEAHGLDRWMSAIASLGAEGALTPRRADGRPAAAASGRAVPIVLWEGCAPFAELLLDEALGAPADGHALRALEAAGVRARVLADERCCGAPLLAAGQVDRFRAQAERVAARLRAAGTRRVIVRCPDCARTLREDYAQAGVKLDAEVVLLAEVLGRAAEKPAAAAAARLAGCSAEAEHAAARLWPGVPVIAAEPLHHGCGWLAAPGGGEVREHSPSRRNGEHSPTRPKAAHGSVGIRQAVDGVLNALARKKAGTLAVACPRCALVLRLLGRPGSWRPGALRVLGPGEPAAGEGVR